MNNNNSKYWLAFAAFEKVSSQFIQKLYEHFSDIELAWKADVSELLQVEGITKKQFDTFVGMRNTVNPEECLSYIKKNDIDFITYEDERYPFLLRNIFDPPMTLFMAGDIERCNLDKTIAVVGSRKASEQSKAVLTEIISELRNSDICIVSGLATGIDTTAHEAAIQNNLTTIAVIGGGFENLYPASNRNLFNSIKEKYGAVLSEYWPTAEPIAWRFPQRNRIVSGISKGTLVAEAALKSGALITANLALEQGRELMCIPGAISNPNTQGIYKLLKNGASMVTSAEDILNTMNWELVKLNNVQSENSSIKELNNIEKAVFELISINSANIDTILQHTDININDLMVILTKLELYGLIKQTDGDRYISTVLK